jgi:hypothetical protein
MFTGGEITGMPTNVCGKTSLYLVQLTAGVITLSVLSAEKQAKSLLTIECDLKRRNYNTRRHHIERCSTLYEALSQSLGGPK